MPTYTNVIEVPEPEPGSYNPNRDAGKLLQSQALHIREALIHHLHDLSAVLAIDPRTLRSEADLGEYVRKATAILHTHSPRSERK